MMEGKKLDDFLAEKFIQSKLAEDFIQIALDISEKKEALGDPWRQSLQSAFPDAFKPLLKHIAIIFFGMYQPNFSEDITREKWLQYVDPVLAQCTVNSQIFVVLFKAIVKARELNNGELLTVQQFAEMVDPATGKNVIIQEAEALTKPKKPKTKQTPKERKALAKAAGATFGDVKRLCLPSDPKYENLFTYCRNSDCGFVYLAPDGKENSWLPYNFNMVPIQYLSTKLQNIYPQGKKIATIYLPDMMKQLGIDPNRRHSEEGRLNSRNLYYENLMQISDRIRIVKPGKDGRAPERWRLFNLPSYQNDIETGTMREYFTVESDILYQIWKERMKEQLVLNNNLISPKISQTNQAVLEMITYISTKLLKKIPIRAKFPVAVKITYKEIYDNAPTLQHIIEQIGNETNKRQLKLKRLKAAYQNAYTGLYKYTDIEERFVIPSINVICPGKKKIDTITRNEPEESIFMLETLPLPNFQKMERGEGIEIICEGIDQDYKVKK